MTHTNFEPKTKSVGDGDTPSSGAERPLQSEPQVTSASDSQEPTGTNLGAHRAANAPSPTIKQTIAGLPILAAADQTDLVKFLVYGDAGAGKTLLAASARDVPDMQPMLFIDAEGGTRTFKNKYPDIPVISIADRYNKQKVISRYGWDIFVDLVEALTADEVYKTYIVDSLSELYALGLFKVMQELVKEKSHRDPDIPDKREWAKTSAIVTAQVRKLIHLPKNIIMTALHDTRTDIEGRIIAHTPVLAGKLTFRIAGFFNELCYLEAVTEKGKVNRRLLTQPANKYLAKSRDDRMPTTIINPTMSDIAKYVFETKENNS